MPDARVKRRLNAPTGADGGVRQKKDRRSRDLARIHILKGQIGLADDSYRDVLWVQGRVDSAKDLDSHGRAEVIAHLEELAQRLGKAKPYARRPHNIDAKRARQELKKIEALLTDAALPWAYAEAILRQQTRGRKTRMAFATAGELVGVVAALHRAAIKRLSAELKRELGEDWEDSGAGYASWLFGFDATHQRFAAYPEMMSQVLRWVRGTLQAVCAWPPKVPCCGGCVRRGVARGQS